MKTCTLVFETSICILLAKAHHMATMNFKGGKDIQSNYALENREPEVTGEQH